MQSITAYGKPRIATLIKYGKSELTPPSPGEIPQAIGQAASLIKSATTMKWRHCTVKVNCHFEKSWFEVKIKKLYSGFDSEVAFLTSISVNFTVQDEKNSDMIHNLN